MHKPAIRSHHHRIHEQSAGMTTRRVADLDPAQIEVIKVSIAEISLSRVSDLPVWRNPSVMRDLAYQR
jgi:hypothetical protein